MTIDRNLERRVEELNGDEHDRAESWRRYIAAGTDPTVLLDENNPYIRQFVGEGNDKTEEQARATVRRINQQQRERQEAAE